MDDSVITFLIFVLLSGVSAWMQKRKAAKEAAEEELLGTPSPSVPPSQPTRPIGAPPVMHPARGEQPAPPRSAPGDWEKELRRILQQPPLTPSAPVLRPIPTRPVTSGPPVIRPVITSQPARQESRPVRRIPVIQEEEGPALSHANLRRADETMARTTSLQEQVNRMMHQVDRKLDAPKPIQIESHRKPTPEVDAAMKLLRNPITVRQAIVASILIGPPLSMRPLEEPR